VHMFVNSSCTDLIFIDWDVSWPAGSMKRLMGHPVDIVGAIYPQRVEPVTFNVRTHEEGVYPVNTDTGLIDVLGLHTGFLRISRNAAEKMTAHYKDTDTYERNGHRIVHLFDRYRVPGTDRMLGDDYSFCQRWVDMGGKCWLDPSFSMGHTGLKTFSGNFGQFITEPAEKAAA